MPTEPRGRERFVRPLFSNRRIRHNYRLMFIDALGWPLGWAVMSSETVLPAFLSNLTDAPWVIALLRTIYALGGWLPVLWAPNLIARRRRRGGFVVFIGIIERIPMLVIGLSALFLAVSHPQAMLFIFFACWAVRSIGEGVNLAPYSALLGESLPANYRGRLWGVSAGIAAVLALPVGVWASRNLETLRFPIGYAVLILVGFVVLTASVLPLGWVRERVAGRPAPEDARCGLRSFRLLRDDPALRRFVLAICVYGIGELALPFYAVHALETLDASDGYIGWYLAAQAAASSLAGFVFGAWTDRVGYRRPLMAGLVVFALAPALAWLAREPWQMIPAFAALGAALQAVVLCRYNMSVELAPEGRVPHYVAVYYSIVMPVFAMAPQLGALLVQGVGTHAVFLPSVIAPLLAVLLVRGLPETRHSA